MAFRPATLEMDEDNHSDALAGWKNRWHADEQHHHHQCKWQVASNHCMQMLILNEVNTPMVFPACFLKMLVKAGFFQCGEKLVGIATIWNLAPNLSLSLNYCGLNRGRGCVMLFSKTSYFVMIFFEICLFSFHSEISLPIDLWKECQIQIVANSN